MTLATALDPVRVALTRWRRAFDARARRERVLLIGAALALVWLAADAAWLTPAFKQWSTARAGEQQAADSLTRLHADITQRGQEARAAERQLQLELAQLRERVAHSDADLRAAGATLVSAREMVPVLDRMLAKSGNLRLLAMQSIGRSPVDAGTAAVAGASAPAPSASTGTLYRHGVELTVEGSYDDLLAYVRAIESSPQHVLWGGLELKVAQYPKVMLTLKLYTLSQDREWLEI